MSFSTPPIDLELFRLINATLRHPFVDPVMRAVSSEAVGAVLAVAIVAYVWRRSRGRALALVFLALLTVGVVDGSVNQFKDFFGRVRPMNALHAVHYYEDGRWQRTEHTEATKSHGVSYPSAHAANSMALAVTLMWLWPAGRPWILGLPLFVGYSRIYLGKHYPTDVLAGWLFGAAAALVLLQLAWTCAHVLSRRRNQTISRA